MLLLLGLVVGVVTLGGVIAAATMLSHRAGASSSREGTVPAAAAPRSADAALGAIPAAWGWARLNQEGRKSVGYYYRDRMAGPSFHILFDEGGAQPSVEQLREMRYRGSVTTRLGAHESMQIPEAAPQLGDMMRRTFDSGGSSGCVVLKLTDAERSELGLPEAPEWIHAYWS